MALSLSLELPAAVNSAHVRPQDMFAQLSLAQEATPQGFELPSVKEVRRSTCAVRKERAFLPGATSNQLYGTAQLDDFERQAIEMVKPCHGTTTLGFIFQHGVIIAVDSRATMGSYICEYWILRGACSGGVPA